MVTSENRYTRLLMKEIKPRVQRVTCTSVVTPNTVLEGNYQGKTDLCVAGTINGDVDVKGAVFVSKDGIVKGSVHGESVIVSGKIEGNVNAGKEVELRDGAQVDGYVISREIHISPGAEVTGDIYSAKKGPFIFSITADDAGGGE